MPDKRALFILSLVLIPFGLREALLMPRQINLSGKELTVSFLGWERRYTVDDIDSCYLDSKQNKGHFFYFVSIQLNNGKKIKVEHIREGNSIFLNALDRWIKTYKPLQQ